MPRAANAEEAKPAANPAPGLGSGRTSCRQGAPPQLVPCNAPRLRRSPHALAALLAALCLLSLACSPAAAAAASPADAAASSAPQSAGPETNWTALVESEWEAQRFTRTRQELLNFRSSCGFLEEAYAASLRQHASLDRVLVFDLRHRRWNGLGNSVRKYFSLLRFARALGRAGFLWLDSCADAPRGRQRYSPDNPIIPENRVWDCVFDLGQHVEGFGGLDWHWDEAKRKQVESLHGPFAEAELGLSYKCAREEGGKPCPSARLLFTRNGSLAFEAPTAEKMAQEAKDGRPPESSMFEYLRTLGDVPWIRIETREAADLMADGETEEVCAANGMHSGSATGARLPGSEAWGRAALSPRACQRRSLTDVALLCRLPSCGVPFQMRTQVSRDPRGCPAARAHASSSSTCAQSRRAAFCLVLRARTPPMLRSAAPSRAPHLPLLATLPLRSPGAVGQARPAAEADREVGGVRSRVAPERFRRPPAKLPGRALQADHTRFAFMSSFDSGRPEHLEHTV